MKAAKQKNVKSRYPRPSVVTRTDVEPFGGNGSPSVPADPKPVAFNAVNGEETPIAEWVHPARAAKAREAEIEIRSRIIAVAVALEARAIDFDAVGHPTSAPETATNGHRGTSLCKSGCDQSPDVQNLEASET